MIGVDASLLAYAVNRFVPEHPRAARVLEELANGETPWALPWPAVHEFLRFVTHPHAVARPLRPGDAWSFIESLVTSPSLRLLAPTERHAAVVAEVLAGADGRRGVAGVGEAGRPGGAVGLAAVGGRGGLPGLDTAAVLREHGVRELLSADIGMRRFGFLSVRDPIHGEPWAPGAGTLRRHRVLRGRRA